jgi:hypothetical protein
MERVPSEDIEEGFPDNRCYHDGVPFTGIGYSLYPTGELESECAYRDGIEDGLSRQYRPDGGLVESGQWSAGHREGLWRSWHLNGVLASEEFCHFGCPLARVRWDEEGRVVEDFVLAKTDPRYQQMLVQREIFNRDGEPVPVPPELPTGADERKPD